jgi:mono/diheme cytochrome c family protein
MRKLIWLLAGALALVLVIAVGSLLFLKTHANGFSARAQPSALEEFAAQTARKIALPEDAKNKQNRVPNSAEVLAEAKAHWADHCATCHANDGSGENTIGRQMYPPTPDMRKPRTQQMSDGELFYIIENGIRLSGMPAWGTGTDKDAQDSWKLVHFIRHLPALSVNEIKEMEKMNPKSVADLDEERQKEEYLKGRSPIEPPKQHKHH